MNMNFSLSLPLSLQPFFSLAPAAFPFPLRAACLPQPCFAFSNLTLDFKLSSFHPPLTVLSSVTTLFVALLPAEPYSYTTARATSNSNNSSGIDIAGLRFACSETSTENCVETCALDQQRSAAQRIEAQRSAPIYLRL